MMSSLRRRWIAALALTAAAATGCAGELSSGSPGGDEAGGAFVSACTVDSASPLGIKPDVPVDYLSRRSETRNSNEWTTAILAEEGSPCLTAKDKAACLAKVDALRKLNNPSLCVGDGSSTRQGCFVTYFLFTRGDEVRISYDTQEEEALMGTIDTPAEAVSIVQKRGYQIGCTATSAPPSGVRSAEGGYDVLSSQTDCKTVYSVIVHVDAQGKITEKSREETDVKPACQELEAR